MRLAAHAPHSVSPELFALLAERWGVASLDLAESPEEARFLADSVAAEMEFVLDALSNHVGALSGLTGRKALLYVSDGLPLTPAEDRCAVLGHLRAVAALTIFDEPTPLAVVGCGYEDAMAGNVVTAHNDPPGMSPHESDQML